MTKIYLYARWTVWLHHWLLIENSSKRKPQRAAFNFFFQQASDFSLAKSSALSYTCTTPTAGTENCVQVSECWSCVKTWKKKKPYKEEIHFSGWAGDFYLFIEQQSFCCGSMDVFFFVSVSVNFFPFFCMVAVQRKAEELDKLTQNPSTSQF